MTGWANLILWPLSVPPDHNCNAYLAEIEGYGWDCPVCWGLLCKCGHEAMEHPAYRIEGECSEGKCVCPRYAPASPASAGTGDNEDESYGGFQTRDYVQHEGLEGADL